LEDEITIKYKKWTGILLVLTCILIGVFLMSSVIGAAHLSTTLIVKMIANKIPLIKNMVDVTWSLGEETIFFKIRLPRIILGMLVGASLAVAGVTLQALFKNPMADPYIVGVSSGAGLGANIAILFGLKIVFFGLSPISFFAFFGAMGVIVVVYNISKVGNNIHVETLLLTGVAMGAFLSAITSFLMYTSGEKLHQLVFWMMGGLWATTWIEVKAIALFVILGMGIIFIYSRDLNLLQLGDDSAQTLGVEVATSKKILLISASLITAFSVSVSGLIGFVGLVIPHIMRILVGPDHRILIPSSALFGAIFLISADTFARTIVSPTEVPVGVITAFCGGPFFLYLLIKRKNKLL